MIGIGACARPRLALGIAVLLAALLASQALAQTVRFEEGDCPFLVVAPEVEGETIACGRLIVPEDRARRSGPTIGLQVAIALSHASEPAAPIVYLEGGPGGSAVMQVPDVWTGSAPRQHGHILVFDRRGTGYSTPSLDCPEVLGIEAATLFGVSYGTRLALTVMRDHPERIVSVILDGAYPPHVNGYDERAWNGRIAFERLFDDCRADAWCDAAYPDLRGAFLAMVDALDASPMFDDEDTAITGDDVVNDLFQLPYDTNALPYLPSIIAAAASGDIDAWLDAQDRIPASVDDDTSDAYWDALDERLLWLTGLDDLELVMAWAQDLPEQMRPLIEGVIRQFADCAVWGVPAADAVENEPVSSPIPTLLPSGAYDPVTPPSWGDKAAAYLLVGTHVVFPDMGHGTIDIRPCPTQIALAFLAEPWTTPDTSCVDDLGPPEFWVP